MPTCKNDPTRKYKGTEPSPKGLGFCAHSEKVGAVKKGKDGNKWEIKQVKDLCSCYIKLINKLYKKNYNFKNINILNIY